MPRRMPAKGTLTAAERQYLRTHGELPHVATPSERMLYICCVEYREFKYYGDPDRNEKTRDMMTAMRIGIRAFALAVLWARSPDEALAESAVKALEREFMRRAKDDPPF